MASDIWLRIKPTGPRDDASDRLHIHYISEGYCGYAGGKWGRTSILNNLDQWLMDQGGTKLTTNERAELELIFDHIDGLAPQAQATYCLYQVSPAFLAGDSGLIQESTFWNTLDIPMPTGTGGTGRTRG